MLKLSKLVDCAKQSVCDISEMTPTENEVKPMNLTSILWLVLAVLFTMPAIAHIDSVPFITYEAPEVDTQQFSYPSGDLNDTTVNCTGSNLTYFDVMKRTLLDDLFVNQDKPNVVGKTVCHGEICISRKSNDVTSIKYFFFAGLAIGSFMVGPMAEHFGRRRCFLILASGSILSVFSMSMCRVWATLAISWFLVGLTLMSQFNLILVELLEKFETFTDNSFEESEDRLERFSKSKLRLLVGLGFAFACLLGRICSLLIAWLTKDWTLIFMCLGIAYTGIYLLFGAFFASNFSEKRKDSDDEETFFHLIKSRNGFLLNLFILAFNWFVSCHNLYSLVISWMNLSPNMFSNTMVSSILHFISIPLAYAVCIATKQKVLPYSLIQLSSGILILSMIACGPVQVKIPSLWDAKILIAHISCVLLSAAFAVIRVITIESFPRRYRIHCLGICNGFARIGLMIGVTLSDLQLFKDVSGRGLAGALAIMGALLCCLLPDFTCHKMPITQKEIYQLQFGRLVKPQSEGLTSIKVAQPQTSTFK